MIVVEVRIAPSFKMGSLRRLFEEKFAWGEIGAHDITSDGKRFLIVKPSEKEQTPAQIRIVLNWFEELKRLVPTEKK